MGVVIKMVDTKRGAGRPRQHDLMTPLRQWVIQNYKGDYAAMAKRGLARRWSSSSAVTRN